METDLKEFNDVFTVLEFGAKKYELQGWLKEDAYKMGHKDNSDSMFHHLSASFVSEGSTDKESGLNHLLHLACRALMEYTRQKRGIRKP